ncbi:uncharacterized protein B0H18DRAFT_962607 [Fomitopsis serialis]|uniref:uncharacterized protein n=1 Tax=Fomitopsis serialis TaxID=139415 RepID=UPI002007EA36|nr:uncharacterized protein B0H18DRAFT_962607 [Neoantrodia serialis]KAH9910983.1 hypothetical protein B0H18DRAFT_962607 [Neoantrodia serialis]
MLARSVKQKLSPEMSGCFGRVLAVPSARDIVFLASKKSGRTICSGASWLVCNAISIDRPDCLQRGLPGHFEFCLLRPQHWEQGMTGRHTLRPEHCNIGPGGSLGTVLRDGEAGRNIGDGAEPAGMHSGWITGNDNVCNVDPDPPAGAGCNVRDG